LNEDKDQFQQQRMVFVGDNGRKNFYNAYDPFIKIPSFDFGDNVI
jgi:hypothetical protein